MTALWLAVVLSITDGDTFRTRVTVWPEQTIETSIRIVCIDTPELRGKCEKEKQLAVEAREALAGLLRNRPVFLSHIEPDKYVGRYLATVQTAEHVDVAGELLKRGLAASYDWRGKKHNWCGPT